MNSSTTTSHGNPSSSRSPPAEESDYFRIKLPLKSKIIIEVSADEEFRQEKPSSIRAESLYSLTSTVTSSTSKRSNKSSSKTYTKTPNNAKHVQTPYCPIASETVYRLSYLPPK